MSIRDGEEARGGPWPERVRREGKRVRTIFRVRYAETDQMGMAYYANYLVWFEVTRGDFIRAIGASYARMEREGTFLPITEARVRYRAPARYDDVVEVVTWISRLRSRLVAFDYRVEREGTLLATGSTVHVPTDRGGSPRALSRELQDLLSGFEVPEP